MSTVPKTAYFPLDEEYVLKYAEWTECAAFRFVDIGNGEVRFEVTNNLERITRPDGAERAA